MVAPSEISSSEHYGEIRDLLLVTLKSCPPFCKLPPQDSELLLPNGSSRYPLLVLRFWILGVDLSGWLLPPHSFRPGHGETNHGSATITLFDEFVLIVLDC